MHFKAVAPPKQTLICLPPFSQQLTHPRLDIFKLLRGNGNKAHHCLRTS